MLVEMAVSIAAAVAVAVVTTTGMTAAMAVSMSVAMAIATSHDFVYVRIFSVGGLIVLGEGVGELTEIKGCPRVESGML